MTDCLAGNIDEALGGGSPLRSLLISSLLSGGINISKGKITGGGKKQTIPAPDTTDIRKVAEIDAPDVRNMVSDMDASDIRKVVNDIDAADIKNAVKDIDVSDIKTTNIKEPTAGTQQGHIRSEIKADIQTAVDVDDCDVVSGKGIEGGGNGSYSLLSGEGDIGTYRDLLDAGEIGDNITPHHMPSAEYMSQYGVGKKDGLCMNMEMPSPGTGGRHRLTDTYGRNMTDAEKAYYYSLSPRDALAYDIANIREIYQSQGLYSEIRPRLQEYIKQYKELMPELFDK